MDTKTTRLGGVHQMQQINAPREFGDLVASLRNTQPWIRISHRNSALVGATAVRIGNVLPKGALAVVAGTVLANSSCSRLFDNLLTEI